MRSSECTYISRGGSGPVFLTCVAIANALFGGLLFVVAVAVLLEPRGDRTWSVTTAVLVAAGAAGWSAQAAGFHRTYVHRVPQDGRRVVATTVALRSSLDRRPGELTGSGWKSALPRPQEAARIHPTCVGPRLRAEDSGNSLRSANRFGGGRPRPPR